MTPFPAGCVILFCSTKPVRENPIEFLQLMKNEKRNGYKMIDVHDVRDINQTVFLHLIRERQPISRADIAKFTGLRAGTVRPSSTASSKTISFTKVPKALRAAADVRKICT